MAREIPEEYIGREQTWLKHEVLRCYLTEWAHKLGSLGQYRATRLWYVDCFAGPWLSQNQELEDTSPYIGLEALKLASETWAKRDVQLDLAAVFVEKDPNAYRDLEQLVRGYEQQVSVYPIQGEFGNHVEEIDRLVGTDPAFLFVDPTGWKGAAMCFLQPLVSKRRRDVMINVMFDHINRFKGRTDEFIREQIAEFFGLEKGAIDSVHGEAALMQLYRDCLKKYGAVKFAADLIVPNPTANRTKFRLVVGGHDKAVLKVFRKAEEQVIGRDAAWVRAEARERLDQSRTGQQPLFDDTIHNEIDRGYEALNRQAFDEVQVHLPQLLKEMGPSKFSEVWPLLLERCHVTESELAHLIMEMHRTEQVNIEGVQARQQRVKDENILSI